MSRNGAVEAMNGGNDAMSMRRDVLKLASSIFEFSRKGFAVSAKCHFRVIFACFFKGKVDTY